MEKVAFVLFNIDFTWEAIGIILAAIFSIFAFAGNIILYFRSKNKTKIEYITNKRVEWIYSVRQEVADFLAIVLKMYAGRESMLDLEEVKELEKKYQIVKLYLNYSGIIDSAIIRTMNSIVDHIRVGNYDKVILLSSKLSDHISIYLKIEWDRVKKEASGKQYKEEHYFTDAIAAYEKYTVRDEIQCIEITEVKEILKQKYKDNIM